MTTLQYGQIVRIHCIFTKETDITSLITSKSYTDPTLYCQTFTNFKSIPNYRESLFEILPMSSFDINDELNNAPQAKRESLEPRAKTQREQFEALISQKQGDPIYFGAQVVFKHYDSGYYITGCFECARSGIGAFKIYLSPILSSEIIFKLQSFRTYEKDGDEINFKAPINIYHELTHCYLSFETEDIFLDVDFRDHDTNEEVQDLDLNDKMLAIRPVVKSPTGRRYELINQNIPKRAWRLEEHEALQPKKPKQLICNHDLVYFLHTKDNKYLLPSISHSGMYLKKIKDQEVLGDFFDGVWEIEEEILETDILINRTTSLTKRTHKSNIMRDSIQGQFDKNKRLIIRHFTSGRVLILNKMAEPEEPVVSTLNQHNLRSQIIMTYDSKNLQNNALVNFKHDSKFMDAIVQRDQHREDAGARDNSLEKAHSEIMEFERDDEKLMAIKNAYEIFYQKCGLTFNQVMNQHGFRIYKFEDEYKRQLLLVLSSQELINQFTTFMTVRNEGYIQKTLNFTLLNDVTNTMKSLVGFIYNCDYDQIKVLGSNPVTQRQKILGDLGMVQLVTSLVCQIDKRSAMLFSMLALNRKSEYTRIRNIYQLGYEILESMAKNNRILKLQISIYMREYLNQILKSENKVVYKSIQVVLEDNYIAIEKIVTRDYIEKLIQSFNKTEPDPKDLKFLSTLCICQGRSIKENQIAVEKLFYRIGMGFKELDLPESDKFKFREDHKVMQIGSTIPGTGNPRYRVLLELYKQCEEELEDAEDSRKDKGHWRYFIEYLNLLADLCMHRNSEAQSYVDTILPLNMLVAFLKETIVKEKSLYQPFIRLAHYAYIENYNYDEISRISKAKYWNDNNETFDIPRAKNEVSVSLHQIMNMIMSYIKKINNKRAREIEGHEQQQTIILDPNNIEQLRNVYTFLELLKSTLNLGFWESMSKLKEMVPCMLRILKFDEDFAEQIYRIASENKSDEDKVIDQGIFRKKVYERTKNLLTLNKPEINMLVKCKILAAEIFDIILDNENNIRVSEITKLFKDILQMNLDLSEFDITEESQAELDRKLRDYKEYHKFKPDNEKERNMLNEKIWIRKLKEMLSKRDIFSEVDRTELNPMLILLEISCYRNETLSNYSLSLLGRIYGQRSEVLQNFSNIIIVSKGNLLDLSRRAQETRSRLLPLASYNILTVSLNSGQQAIWDTKGKDTTTVIQELAYLTLKMKKNNNDNPMTLYEHESLYPYAPIHDERARQERTFSIISEKEQPNTLHQNLIKSQDHHLILYEFIKIMEELPESELPSKVLHAVYNFLTVLVWNNKENKDSLEYFLKKAEVHLQYNIGCIDFFREMYSNNKKLVNAQNDLSRLVDLIVSTANRLEISKYYKSKLMDFLRVLVIFDDKGQQKNQNIVMEVISRYQVSSSNKTVFISNPKYWSIKPLEFEEWINIYSLAYKNSCDHLVDLKISPELSYIAHFFQIFSALIENENTINIGKCTNMHPYEWLIDLIERAKNCWPVVRFLRSYINKLYYAESREIQTQQYELFVSKELRIISEQLLSIARLRENCPNFGTIRIQNPIRYTYIASYVFMSIEEILVSLKSMFASNDFVGYFNVIIGQNKETKATFHYDMIHIVETLSYLMVRLEGRYINKFMEEVRDLMRSILIISFPLDILTQYERHNKAIIAQLAKKHQEQYGSAEETPFKKRYVFYETKTFWRQLIDWYSFDKQDKQRSKMINEIELKEERDRRATNQDTDLQKEKEYRVNNICLGKIEKKIKEHKRNADPQEAAVPQQKTNQPADDVLKGENIIVPKNLLTSKSKHFKLKNEPQLTPEKENIVVNTRRRKLLKFITVNKSFDDFKMEEFYEFCEQLANADNYSLQKYQMVVIGAQDIIKAFVEMNQINPNFLRYELKLTLLSLLTNYITRNNPQAYKTMSVDQWKNTHWSKNRPTITMAQDFLNSCNCAKLICSLIKYNLESSLEIANRLLLFGVAFLLGGNRACQDSFMAYFIKDDKNIIFSQLEKLIKRSNERISLSAGSKAQVDSIRLTHSDTYDFYDDRQNIMERRFGYEQETSQEQKLFNQLVSALRRVYRFLQLLCESNNSQMKNYIRMQVDAEGKVKANNLDFIEITNVELRRLFKILDQRLVKLPLSLIDFLNEVTQLPCVDNQITLCKGTFFEDICLVQKTSQERSEFEMQTLLQIYNKSIEIALSCLEGNQLRIFQDLSTKTDSYFFVSLIEENLKEITSYRSGFKAFKNELKESKTHDGKIRQILKIVCVVSKLEAWGGNLKFTTSFDKSLSDEMRLVVKLLRQNLLCIEILNETPQLVYFPYNPVYKYLSDFTKDKIMFEINRETTRDKSIGLLKTGKQIANEIDYNYYLDHYELIKPFFTISVTSKRISQFRVMAQSISVVICLLMIMWAQVYYYPEDEQVEYSLGHRQQIINILSVVQFLFTFLYISMWLANRIHLSICKYEEQLKKKAKQSQGIEAQAKQFQKDSASIGGFLMGFRIIKILYCLYMYENEFLSVMLFFVASLLGTFYKIQFYSLHLFDLVAQIDLLTNVFQAVTLNVRLLGIVSLLGVSFIGIFSVFSFSSYISSIYPQDVPKEHCESVTSCIMTLYLSEQINNDVTMFDPFRFGFDLLYVIFMDLLFGNIISGIMIDTFASQRDRRKKIESDKKGVCFICGITRQTLEKDSIALEEHYISRHHFLWNYVFYAYYLFHKQTQQVKDTFTGLEYIIKEKIEKENATWIPTQADQEEDISEQLKQLQDQVTKCTKIITKALPGTTNE